MLGVWGVRKGKQEVHGLPGPWSRPLDLVGGMGTVTSTGRQEVAPPIPHPILQLLPDLARS